MLLNVSDTSSPSVGGGNVDSFSEKEEYIDLLGGLGRAVAVGAEAGENLDDIKAGSLGLKVESNTVPAFAISVPKTLSRKIRGARYFDASTAG